MSRSRSLLLGVVCAVLAAAPLAGLAESAASARKTIQHAYDSMAAAAAKKDIKAMFAYYAPEYVAISPKGQKLTLDQQKAGVSQMLGAAQTVAVHANVRSVALKSKDAIVGVSKRFDGTMLNPQTHRPSMIVITEKTLDTWRHGKRGWILTRSVLQQQKVTVDGREMATR